MVPHDLAYDICRCYIKDHEAVIEPGLIASVLGMVRSRNLEGLSSCTGHFDGASHSIDTWRFLRQIEAFFKKNSVYADADDCAVAALRSFSNGEKQCSLTNLRLDYCYLQRRLLDADLQLQLSKMQSYIRRVLGDFQVFLDALPHLVKVTPGATAHTSRRDSIPQLKVKKKLWCTPDASSYLVALFRYYGFKPPKLKHCHSNRIELVPKNWKTDRTIACEPEGNLPLQLAFDVYAKRRLRRFGIDLSDQSANQRLAHEGSVKNNWVTVDFENASNTISYNTVAWLLPFDWFTYLARVRSPKYRGVFGGGSYQMFSSMGNGATFTLETLIFAAACFAVGSREFKVYGDDVIIEKEFYAEYLKLTRFLGFTVNTSKTFSDGPFRESCGKDYWSGIDVTPVYIRRLDKRKALKSHLINTLARLTYPESSLGNLLIDLTRQWKLPFVPYQESTISGVWIDPDIARKRGTLTMSVDKKLYFRAIVNGKIKKKVIRGQRPWIEVFKSYQPVSQKVSFVDSRGYYLWFLRKYACVQFAVPWIEARFDKPYSKLRKKDSNSSHDETSSATIFSHAYVRKWVVWHMPNEGLPLHLEWWSKEVTRQN